ncbi:MAG: sigma-54 dependent transcriptional regulator [Bacteroidia bacterium]|nr:sigma-54 dependent transcriptional regulator [Bacteroidia bacterium]
MPKILIIDDEEVIRSTLREILEYEEYEVETAADGKEGLDMALENTYDVVICDIKMPKMNGLEVLEKAMEAKPDTPFVMISGHADIDTAVDATKKGAYDFLEKPPDLNRLLLTLRNAAEKRDLVVETKRLRRKVSRVRDIIGTSPVMEKIKDTISRVAQTDARVLVTGSNGTGKELVARWVHEKSRRANAPIVEVNCAAIPSELIESELFGHEKGSFTGAYKQRVGKFEQAHGGTLFLDEIGDMSLSAQAKVLRALQENKITRIGSDREIQVDVRIVAATNKDLLLEIERGNFREDLYHRLSVILIHVPPLRERREDIPLLIKSFLTEIAEEQGMAPIEIAPDALEELIRLEWTGNVRELHNVIERLAILSYGRITHQDVMDYAVPRRSRPKTASVYDDHEKFQEFKDHVEKEFIIRKLEQCGWNISKAADMLDIQRSHLYNKMEKFNIKREVTE